MIEIPAVHPLLVPGNQPPLVYGLAVLYPGEEGEGEEKIEVYSILSSGIPPKIYNLIMNEPIACYFPGDMQLMGRQYFGVESLPTWFVADTEPLLEDVQAVDTVDWRFPGDIDMSTIKRLLKGIKGSSDWDMENARSHDEWVEKGQTVEEIKGDDAEFMAAWSSKRRKTGDGTGLSLAQNTPHMANQNLLAYLADYTFSPTRAYYHLELQSRTSRMGEVAKDTIEKQARVHDRMLKSGSSQPTCAGDIKVGDYVRYAVQPKRHRDPTPAEAIRGIRHNSTLEPDGSQTWTDRPYRVTEVQGATETEGARFKLRGPKRAWFYRGELCPVNNVQEGAIVRIRLAANPFYRRQIEQIIKSGERLFKYNHMYSRSLFTVASKYSDSEGTDRYFLTTLWRGGTVFKTAVWETEEAENQWSEEHNGFNGYLVQDLVRVDQQTALLLGQEGGVEKYTQYIRDVAFRVAPNKTKYDKDGNLRTVATVTPVEPGPSTVTPTLVAGDAAWVGHTTPVIEWLNGQGVLKSDRLSFHIFTPQRGPLWLDLRRTVMTASKLETWNLGVSRGADSVGLDRFIEEVREHFSPVERPLHIGNFFQEAMKQKNMHWGTIHEDHALRAYQAHLLIRSPVYEVRAGTTIPGMVIDRAFQISASPDGWVFDSADPDARHIGVVEFKCPVGLFFRKNPGREFDPRIQGNLQHIYTKLAITPGKQYTEMHDLRLHNKNYYYQCMANLFLTSAEWIDFVAWVPPGAFEFVDSAPNQKNLKIHRFYRADMKAHWETLLSGLTLRHKRYQDVFTDNMARFLSKYKEARAPSNGES
jgi:hypothetical protein